MSNPVEELEKARSALVAMRRQWVTTLADGYQRGKTEEATEKLVQIQKAIEAIDKALVDEQKSLAAGALKNFSPDDPFSEEVPGG
jgi:hypothetical protein